MTSIPYGVERKAIVEKIAEVIHDALTLPNPKVRYHIAPDTMRHVLAAVLPKRVMDRMIAKRLGLMPPST